MSTAPATNPLPSGSPSRKDAAARAARLFERHGRMVYGICRALLRDPHDAEDATQQTFLSAYRALLGGARIRDDGAWLATIARNESRARIAAGMRAPLPIPDEDLEAIPTATDEAERSAQAEELRNAIAELPERQREAVVLRHLYGLSYGEVATALGLSRPATEALLFRARRAMRLRLRPAVATAIIVPLSVQEGLAQAIPGFTAAAGAGGLVTGAAGGGLLAKLASGPVAAKIATAAVAVTTVGAVGTVDSERAGRDRAERGGNVANVGSRVSDDDSSGSGPSGRSEEGDDSGSGSSGSGSSGRDDRDDDSGPRNTSSGSSGDDDGRDVEDDSGPSGGGEDDEPSGQDGSGSDDGGGGGSGSDGGGEDDSVKPDDSSGSGSDSSGSGSSDSGSGEDTPDDSSGSDSSGHDSGSDDGSDSSGSGSSDSGSGGSGSSGSADDDPDD